MHMGFTLRDQGFAGLLQGSTECSRTQGEARDAGLSCQEAKQFQEIQGKSPGILFRLFVKNKQTKPHQSQTSTDRPQAKARGVKGKEGMRATPQPLAFYAPVLLQFIMYFPGPNPVTQTEQR